VQPGTRGCAITDNVEEHVTHFWGSSLVTTYQCTELQQYAGGLVLTSCGTESSIYLPPPVPPAK
jgi:hypothetical protein